MTTAHAPNPEAARNHLLHCRQYMDNALEALRKNEPSKAGELLWGSFAQAVHAVDAWRGAVIDSHRDLIAFARQVGQETGDPNFPLIIAAARSLHNNFYVPVETVEEVDGVLPGIQSAIDQILALLPDDARGGADLA